MISTRAYAARTAAATTIATLTAAATLTDTTAAVRQIVLVQVAGAVISTAVAARAFTIHRMHGRLALLVREGLDVRSCTRCGRWWLAHSSTQRKWCDACHR